MKMGKKFRAIASAALISAMVMSMNGMTTLADPGEPGSVEWSPLFKSQVVSVDLTKNVLTDGCTYAPDTTFKFTIANGEGGRFEDTVVFPGKDDALSFSNTGVDLTGEIVFSPTAASMSELSPKYTNTAKIYIDSTKFSQPGIYHYTVTETAGTYEGIDYNATPVNLYVYVERQKVNTQEYVYATAVVAAVGDTKTELKIDNDYGQTNNETHYVIVTKQVTGNQGDTSKLFDFTVKVTGDNRTNNEQYLLEYGYFDENEKWVRTPGTEDITLVNGVQNTTIKLSHDQKFRISGLTANDIVTIDEKDYTEENYSTAYATTANNVTAEGETGKIEVKVTANAQTITVTNDKTVTTPTGIIMSFAPYILVLALAGVFAVMFLRKKREDF